MDDTVTSCLKNRTYGHKGHKRHEGHKGHEKVRTVRTIRHGDVRHEDIDVLAPRSEQFDVMIVMMMPVLSVVWLRSNRWSAVLMFRRVHIPGMVMSTLLRRLGCLRR